MPPLRSRGFGHTGWKQQHAQALADKVLEMPHHDTLPSRIQVSSRSSGSYRCRSFAVQHRMFGFYLVQARLDDIFSGCRCPAGIDAALFLSHLSQLFVDITASTSTPQPPSDAAYTWLPHAHFATSLLHAYLALSWRPLKDSMFSGDVDDLAAAASWDLPTGIYAAAVEALGLHPLLLELLAFIPSTSSPPRALLESSSQPLNGISSPQHLVLLAELLQARPSLSVGLMAAMMPQADFTGSSCAERPALAELEQGQATLLVLVAALRCWHSAAVPSLEAAGQRLRCLQALCLFIIRCLSSSASGSARSIRLPGPVLTVLGIHPRQGEEPIPVAVVLADALGSMGALLCEWQDDLCREEGVAGLLVLLDHMAGRLGAYTMPGPQQQQHDWPCAPLDATALIQIKCRLMLFKAAATQGATASSGPMSRRPVPALISSPLLKVALWECGIPLSSPLDPMLATVCSSPCNVSSQSPVGISREGTPSLWTLLPGMRGHEGSSSARAICNLVAGAAGSCMRVEINTTYLAAWSLPCVNGSIGAAWAQRLAGKTRVFGIHCTPGGGRGKRKQPHSATLDLCLPNSSTAYQSITTVQALPWPC